MGSRFSTPDQNGELRVNSCSLSTRRLQRWLLKHGPSMSFQLLRLELLRNQLGPGLPPEIGSLVALRELCVDNNNLVDLPPELQQLAQLEEFRCSSNALVGMLPPFICQMTSLKEVSPACCYLRVVSVPTSTPHFTLHEIRVVIFAPTGVTFKQPALSTSRRNGSAWQP